MVSIDPSSSRRASTTRRRWTFRAVAVIGAVIVCEVALQGASRLVPAVDLALMPRYQREWVTAIPARIPDPKTGRRGNPEYPGHDRRGYANLLIPDRADVVALGDSVTYGLVGSNRLGRGVPVSPRDSWPAVVGELLGTTVYNMGAGGWGPVECLQVLDEALAMNPQTIVLGFFFGNDLFDCFQQVYVHGRRQDLADPAFTDAVAAAEENNPWFDAVTGEFISQSVTKASPTGSPSFLRRGRIMLSAHCKLYGLLRSAKDRCLQIAGADPASVAAAKDDWDVARQWAAERSDRYCTFENGPFRTVLAAPYRYAVLNLNDARIRASLSITSQVMRQCAARCRTRGVDFVVVLLPTKELVFEAIVDDTGKYPKYPELTTFEHTVRNRIITQLDEHGIAWVDTLPALRACLDRGEQPYPISADGHPNLIGYRAIAEAVAQHINDRQACNRP